MKNFLLVMVVVLISSCAQNQIVLSGKELPYTTSASVTPVVMGTKNLEIVEVVDNRENKDVGIARTGVQYRETPVKLAQDMDAFVKDFFQTALYKRNIMLTDEAPIKLQIIINKLWLSEVLNNNEAAKCEANFSFIAHEKDRTWKGNVWTEYQSRGDLSDGTDKLGPTLATCMNNIVEKLVTDSTFITFIQK